MKTVITLHDKTVIQTTGKEVVPIASKVKITSKMATQAQTERQRVENAIFNRLDRGIAKANRSINQREARRAKRA